MIIQTYSPEHYALQAAQKHSYSDFTDRELGARRELAYPPFGWLTSILFESKSPRDTEDAARLVASHGRTLLARDAKLRAAVSQLGPAQAPLARLRGKSRWQLLLKGKGRAELRTFTAALLSAIDYGSGRPLIAGVAVFVDVDPQSMP